MQFQQSLPTLPSHKSAREASAWLKDFGLPSRGTEHWRMTPITPLLQQEFVLSPCTDNVQAMVDVYRAEMSVADGCLMVMVAGEYRTALSDIDASGLTVRTATEAIDGVDFARLPFAAQNLCQQGNTTLVLEVADGCTVSGVVHLLQLHQTSGQSANFTRVDVRVGKSAQFCLVETHRSLTNTDDAAKGFAAYSNSLVRMSVADNARLSHYKWQDLDLAHAHIAANITEVGENAVLDGFVLNMGGRLVRQDSEIVISASGATATLNGAYVARGDQHIDNTSQIQHNAPDSYSREVYKGVLSDEGRGVFQARIRVDQCAQRTDAYQMNRALLLSALSEVQSKPELEIYADDVKCSHGATVGQLDQDQLFYLMARGILRKDAQVMLIDAYLEDVFADMHNTDIAAKFATIARAKLHDMATHSPIISG